MLVGSTLSTVGAVMAIVGGIAAVAGTVVRLVWDAQDRRRRRRTESAANLPRMQTYTEEEMFNVIRQHGARCDYGREVAKGPRLALPTLVVFLVLVGLLLVLLDRVL
jgi:hypothetical protein